MTTPAPTFDDIINSLPYTQRLHTCALIATRPVIGLTPDDVAYAKKVVTTINAHPSFGKSERENASRRVKQLAHTLSDDPTLAQIIVHTVS